MEDLHLVAGQVLEKLDQKKGTINNLILGDPGITQKRAVYAIVVESLKCKTLLIRILPLFIFGPALNVMLCL